MENFESMYWSGQGPSFLGDHVAGGEPEGFAFMGDVSSVEVSPSSDRTPIVENVTGKRLEADSIAGATTYNLTITLKSAKPEHLALSVGMDLTVKASGSRTDEPVTGYHDKFLRLPDAKTSNLVLTDNTGTTTYTAGTDYVFYGDEGMVEILSTGAISSGQVLHADYDYAGQKKLTGNYVDKARTLFCPAMNRVNSRNGKRGRLSLHKISLDPGFLAAIQDGDTEAGIQLTGRVLADTARSAGDELYSWDMED